jgi:hypothetical protein
MSLTVWKSLQGQSAIEGLLGGCCLLAGAASTSCVAAVQSLDGPSSVATLLTPPAFSPAGIPARHPRLSGALAASALSIIVGIAVTQNIFTVTQRLHADSAASCAGSESPMCSPVYLADNILSTPVGWAVFTLFQTCFVGMTAVQIVEAARPGMYLFAGPNVVLCFVSAVSFSTGFLICWLPCLWVSRALQAPSSKAAASRQPTHMTAGEAACVGCGILALAIVTALQLIDSARSWTIYTPAGILLCTVRGLFVHMPTVWRRVSGAPAAVDSTSSSLPGGSSTPAATMLRALAVVLAAWHVGMVAFFASIGWPFEDLWAVIAAAEQHVQRQGAYIVWVDVLAMMLVMFAYVSYQWPQLPSGGALGRCVRAAGSAILLGPGTALVLVAADHEDALLAAALMITKEV